MKQETITITKEQVLEVFKQWYFESDGQPSHLHKAVIKASAAHFWKLLKEQKVK